MNLGIRGNDGVCARVGVRVRARACVNVFLGAVRMKLQEQEGAGREGAACCCVRLCVRG